MSSSLQWSNQHLNVIQLKKRYPRVCASLPDNSDKILVTCVAGISRIIRQFTADVFNNKMQ
jgi:hypothetical protein